MTHTSLIRSWLFIMVLLLTACSGNLPQQTPLASQAQVQTGKQATSSNTRDLAVSIRDQLEKGPTTPAHNQLSIRGVTLHEGVTKFYQQRDYQPVWTDKVLLDQLVIALEDLRFDGLDPSEYSHGELEKWQIHFTTLTSLTELAALDIKATEACIKALVHLRRGKLDPGKLHPQWNFSAPQLDTQQGLDLLDAAIKERQLVGLFDHARLQQQVYTQLREGLRDLYHLQTLGGWPKIPDGPTLKPGTSDPRVVPLRKRLVAAGVLDPSLAEGNHFDESLRLAVIRFQKEQSLDIDGAVGRQTLAVMNVPIEQRIDQVKANLERGRWLLHEVNGDFVWVDIAAYQVHLYRAGKPVWSARVQVGKPYRSTPIFKSRVSYVTFNPTWTVPPTIFKEDMLPKIRNNLDYLKDHRLTVLDGRGNPLDPTSIDWEHPGNIMLREEAGPLNALGRVVIRFPNSEAIYMHDTPNKGNFSRGARAFSSGCIRVERPLELVEKLFNDPEKWNRETIDAAIASGETRDAGFKVKIPILLTYSTVAIGDNGRLAFKEDIYQRDPPLIAALARKMP